MQSEASSQFLGLISQCTDADQLPEQCEKVLINLNHGRRWQIFVHLTRHPNVTAASFSGRIAAAERVCGVVRLAMQTKHLT